MESNVLSWYTALDKGYEPGDYPYTSDKIPLGEFIATLDFKIWAKKVMAVCCYFTQKDTGIKFQLTTYRRKKDELYMIEGSNVDFKTCPINVNYLISVYFNGVQKPVLKNVVPV